MKNRLSGWMYSLLMGFIAICLLGFYFLTDQTEAGKEYAVRDAYLTRGSS